MMHVKIAKADYTHPRFTNPDVAKDDWAGMAREATAALWRRKDSYPNLIANGKMDKAEAEADIAAWQEIANDWDWICTGMGDHAHKDTLTARIEAIDLAIFRFLQLLDRNHGCGNPDQLHQGALLSTMRWWAQREANGNYLNHARFNASIGHTWRAENGHSPRGEMHTSEPNEERKAA